MNPLAMHYIDASHICYIYILLPITLTAVFSFNHLYSIANIYLRFIDQKIKKANKNCTQVPSTAQMFHITRPKLLFLSLFQLYIILARGKLIENESIGKIANSCFYLLVQRNQRSNCQHLLDHQKSKRVPEKHLFLLY